MQVVVVVAGGVGRRRLGLAAALALGLAAGSGAVAVHGGELGFRLAGGGGGGAIEGARRQTGWLGPRVALGAVGFNPKWARAAVVRLI